MTIITLRNIASTGALLAATVTAQAQVTFTEIALINLDSTSGSGNPEFVGSNPSAIAWDGTDLFVAGYNNTGQGPQDTSIVKVSDALNTATVGARFAVQVGTPNFRGYSGLDISGGVLAAAFDDSNIDPQGITNWNSTTQANICSFAERGSCGVGFDPDFNGAGGSGSGTGFLVFGSGRRNLLDGSCGVLFDTTDGMIVIPGSTTGTLWRDIDFDDATGDAYMRRSNDVIKAVRGGSNAVASASIIVDNMENGQFISQQNIAFINSTTFGEMVIYNDRPASGTSQSFTFIVKVIDPNGAPLTASFEDPMGSALTFATGNGAYDFSWDQASQTLAILDFANRNAHIFLLGDVPVNVSEACNGDGGDQLGCTDCPCGNNAPQGTMGGCVNSAGTSTRLLQSGSVSVAAADLRFEASGAPPANSAVLTSGNALAPANMANPCFGLNSGVQSVSLDGLRCAVQGVLRHGVRPSDASGDIGVTTNGWGTPNGFFNFGAFTSGSTKHFQIIHRDNTMAVCGTGQNTSQAVSVTFEM